jgi:hypothetical protein
MTVVVLGVKSSFVVPSHRERLHAVALLPALQPLLTHDATPGGDVGHGGHRRSQAKATSFTE